MKQPSEYTQHIRDGVFEDRRFYGRIWAAEQFPIEYREKRSDTILTCDRTRAAKQC
jgi:hypothetical protein